MRFTESLIAAATDQALAVLPLALLTGCYHVIRLQLQGLLPCRLSGAILEADDLTIYCHDMLCQFCQSIYQYKMALAFAMFGELWGRALSSCTCGGLRALEA